MGKILCYGIETPGDCPHLVDLFDPSGNWHGGKCSLKSDNECIYFCDTSDDPSKFPTDCPLSDESREQMEVRKGSIIGKVICYPIDKPTKCPRRVELYDKSGNFQGAKCSVMEYTDHFFYCNTLNEKKFPNDCPLVDDGDEQ